MTAPESTPSTPTPVSSLSRDAGITASVAALFFLLRVLAVSGWDWNTAAEVGATVDFGDAASIMLGTVFAEPRLTGALIIAFSPLLVVGLIWPPSQKRTEPILAGVFLILVAVLAASLIATFGLWWIAWGSALTTAAFAAVRILWRHGRIHKATLHLLRSLGVIGIIGVLGLAAAVSTPWVALERIETTTTTITGYVLQTPSGFLKVLNDDPRKVVTLISSHVESRQVTSSPTG